MIRTAAVVSLLSLIPQALATAPLDPRTHTIVRADDVLHRSYSSLGVTLRTSDFFLDTTLAELDLRDVEHDSNNTESSSSSSGSSSSSNSNSTMNWNAETDAACTSALTSMLQSNNPSGTAVCYNLPSLDTKTGAFTADMRLYKVADATGSFAGVSLAEMHVMVSFPYSTVTKMTAPSTSSSTGSGSGSGNETEKRSSDSGAPMLLESYMLAGHINQNNMTSNMSMSTLQALLMPTVTLSATTPSSQNITATVSANGASFLTGVFSKAVVMSTIALAQAAVNSEIAKLEAGDVAFVMPGLQILILPIGLVITLAWTAIGVTAYAFGTVERMRHADGFQKKQRQILRWGRTNKAYN